MPLVKVVDHKKRVIIGRNENDRKYHIKTQTYHLIIIMIMMMIVSNGNV